LAPTLNSNTQQGVELCLQVGQPAFSLHDENIVGSHHQNSCLIKYMKVPRSLSRCLVLPPHVSTKAVPYLKTKSCVTCNDVKCHVLCASSSSRTAYNLHPASNCFHSDCSVILCTHILNFQVYLGLCPRREAWLTAGQHSVWYHLKKTVSPLSARDGLPWMVLYDTGLSSKCVEHKALMWPPGLSVTICH